jgi:endonuclease/exonuclease/phosphatase family metal-dependent hydrolase
MEKRRIRVLSYNIHKGFNSGNRRFVLGKIRSAIRMVHADIVFLQEVLGQHEVHGKHIKDWPTVPQFEYLSDRIWPHFAYGKNAVYTSGHHGNAILSKYPFSFWENIDISTNKLERRGLLHGIIEIPHKRKPLHTICIHLGLLETERQAQIRVLCRRINELIPDDEPMVIAGDFNDWRGRATQSLQNMIEAREAFQVLSGAHARTFPSWLPALRLDRIYFRGLRPLSARCLAGRPWSQLSDHTALYAELDV